MKLLAVTQSVLLLVLLVLLVLLPVTNRMMFLNGVVWRIALTLSILIVHVLHRVDCQKPSGASPGNTSILGQELMAGCRRAARSTSALLSDGKWKGS